MTPLDDTHTASQNPESETDREAPTAPLTETHIHTHPSTHSHTDTLTNPHFHTNDPRAAPFVLSLRDRPSMGFQTIQGDALNSLAFHAAVLGFTVGVGYFLKQLLIQIENTNTTLSNFGFFAGFPLYPFCLLAGVIVQKVISRFSDSQPIDRATAENVSGVCLDFLVLAAVATMSLTAVWDSFWAFCLLMLIGVMWHLFCFFLLAPRMLTDYWFERALASLGQEMGVLATGLILLRTVDPHNHTHVANSFAIKQLIFESVFYGWWTAAIIPILGKLGSVVGLVLSMLVMLGAACVWWVSVRPLFHLNADPVLQRSQHTPSYHTLS
eukprot:TRINITY_DN10554_c0_g1_i2.p1 TRINITY_DN10554_c0_g1~~TRINITY_DN10554_c0_g1_i2.p1  ORF type:complete len:325 (-),score=72.47 TRINITY_DN10554_c0_g1_i2:7-981(-)